MAILRVTGLVKSYSRRRVVDGVDVEVQPGEIVGLLGPNGAGKTTCFRMTCGMVAPDQGRVELAGQDVTNWPMYRRARDGGMGYLAQESSVFRKLSVRDNLLCMMEMIGMGRRQRRLRCEELMERFQITHIQRSKAGKLSGGERRRLEFARCLISNPKIILLDEPFAAVDPVTVNSIQTVIRELRDDNISFLITDHGVREILAITDRTYVMRAGKVLCHGSAAEITNNPEARKYYFGDSIQINEPQTDWRDDNQPHPVDQREQEHVLPFDESRQAVPGPHYLDRSESSREHVHQEEQKAARPTRRRGFWQK